MKIHLKTSEFFSVNKTKPQTMPSLCILFGALLLTLSTTGQSAGKGINEMRDKRAAERGGTNNHNSANFSFYQTSPAHTHMHTVALHTCNIR